MADSIVILQGNNKECHKCEIAADQGKTCKPKAPIGADGWPVEF